MKIEEIKKIYVERCSKCGRLYEVERGKENSSSKECKECEKS